MDEKTRLDKIRKILGQPPESLEVFKHLDAMMKADIALYEKILDTPGFAFSFNEIVKLAARSTDLEGIITRAKEAGVGIYFITGTPEAQSLKAMSDIMIYQQELIHKLSGGPADWHNAPDTPHNDENS